MSYQEIFDSWKGNNLHKWLHYIPIYEELLSRYEAYADLKLLEIGVQRGGGCLMHRKRFPKAFIVGLDIDPHCQKVEGCPDILVIGDQSSQNDLNQLVKVGPYDIIIDDGGHTPDQQITSFYGLWSSLNIGGTYICEDIFTNAVPGYTASRYGITFIDLAKGLADKLGWWVMDKECFRNLNGTNNSYNYKFNNFAVDEIQSVMFYNGLIAIRKQQIQPPIHQVK